MKFPKSIHAEGWIDHVAKTEPEHLPEALSANGTAPLRRPVTSMAAPAVTARVDDTRRTRIDTPTTPVAAAAGFTAPPSPTVVAPRQPAIAPWVIGAGAGAVLIAVAVMVSRNFAPSVDPIAPPAVVSEAAKPSPEDTQLAAAPSGAGPVTTPETTQTPPEAPAVTPALPPQPPVTTVAAAPAEPKPAPAAKVQAPAPQQSPVVTRTLTPPPETLAQVSPPPVTLQQPVQPAVPATVTPSAITPMVTPPTAQPVQPAVPPVATAPTPDQSTVPPLAQAQPQPQPAVPEDAGITVKVRTALASDTVLAAVPIAVSTDHGVVKLEGQAPDSLARERATVVAAATQGVKGVDNRLTVPPVAQLQLEPQVAKAPGG
jgi:hypothetical protein